VFVVEGAQLMDIDTVTTIFRRNMSTLAREHAAASRHRVRPRRPGPPPSWPAAA